MSGPKCSDWEVRDNRIQEERGRLAAFAEVEALFVVVANLQRSVVVERARVGAPAVEQAAILPERPDASETRLNLESSILLLDEVRTRLEADRTWIAALGQMANLVAKAVSGQAARKEAGAAAATAALKIVIEARSQTVNRIMSRLPSGLPPDQVGQLAEVAQKFVLALDDGFSNGLELELRRRVQGMQDAAARRVNDLAAVADLRSALRGYQDDASIAVIDQLRGVVAGSRTLDAGLAARARAVAQEARARADREYASQVLSEEFSALGYEVGEQFSTAFLHGGTMVLSRPDAGGYGVEVAFEAGRQSLNTRLVRLRDEDIGASERALRDKEAEESFCGDYSRVLASAAKRQVQARLTKRLPAGAMPVPLAPGIDKREDARLRKQRADVLRGPAQQEPRQGKGD